MNNKKQSAVESIIKKINNIKPSQFCSIETIKQWCIEAKEIEKEQIIDAYKFGIQDEYVIGSEQYYNETYTHSINTVK
jgi:hypothetical protein